jgi:mono/diheme cytochrome c family protein
LVSGEWSSGKRATVILSAATVILSAAKNPGQPRFEILRCAQNDNPTTRRSPLTYLLVVIFPLLLGCTSDMARQPRYQPLEPSSFFADGQASRPLVPGTVPRGHLRTDQAFFAGVEDDKLLERLPLEKLAERMHLTGSREQIAEKVLNRGRQRFDIFCAPCHGRTGDGDGMVVQRGFPRPPSYHIDRLRQAADGHIFDVITRGLGRMPSHAAKIPADDRWAIVAYLRALQFSQHAPVDQLSAEDRENLVDEESTDEDKDPREEGRAKTKNE